MVSFVTASLVASAFAADEFPTPYNTEPEAHGAPLPPEEAAKAIKMPEGFRVSVFAAEPEVRNPISMAWDGRGRLWVAENYTYAETPKKAAPGDERPKRFDMRLRDRILIFTDRDGDGKPDDRKVFSDDLQMLTSIELGRGGVWAMCPPQVLFIPDRDGDDRPDGPAEVVLDGFTVPPENSHNFANGLRFGPDGWLYGRCGASAPGLVGLPGSPADQRLPLRGGIWRYHPQRKTFETLCHGTTNPWGHDWNEHGELFFVNTVNGHLWHMIPGSHLVRPHTIDPNPHVYECIDMHADHWHFDIGEGHNAWAKGKTGVHDSYGGGHAHQGATIYLGDQWSEKYKGRLLTFNLHGHRSNVERLERHGSGYVGKHEPDIMISSDPWFRGLELSYGPDGSVFVLDWSDAGECHENDGVHRTSGRIFRVTSLRDTPVAGLDLAAASPMELVDMHRHANEWYARQARSQLLDRAAAGQDMSEACRRLQTFPPAMFRHKVDVVVQLRQLWTLFALGAIDADNVGLLDDENEHVRTWGVRMLSDAWPLDGVMGPTDATVKSVNPKVLERLTRLAREDSSGLVRLSLASTLQRLPVSQRSTLAAALVTRSEDANDHNLPMMVWYGLIPVADSDPDALVNVANASTWPLVRRWIARRLGEDLAERPKPVDALLTAAAKDGPSPRLHDVLTGLSEGLAGKHKAPQPAAWAAVQSATTNATDPAVIALVRDLSVLFGDGRALGEVQAIALNDKADLNQRRIALETLIEIRSPDLQQTCEKLIGVRWLNSTAVKGLALFNDRKIGEKLAAKYKSFHHSERAAVIETLVSRPTFAAAMLDEMAKGTIPKADLTAFQARQVRSFHDEKLTARLGEVWGEIRDSAEDKQNAIAKLKQQLSSDVLASADPEKGRLTFNTACASCHRLYGHGGDIGPDLTGAGRQNLDYLLSNILDPSAVVAADFRMSIVQLADGRVLNGIVRAQTPQSVTLQGAKERVTVDRADIETMAAAPLSLMPDGLLQPMTPEQVRDLIAYLMTRSQVALAEQQSSK